MRSRTDERLEETACTRRYAIRQRTWFSKLNGLRVADVTEIPVEELRTFR